MPVPPGERVGSYEILGALSSAGRPRFKVLARDFGAMRPGLSLDSVADLLEQVEGPLHR